MSALRNARNKLNLDESFGKESGKIEKLSTPSASSLHRGTEDIFENLNSFRDDIRKKINEKFKNESKPLSRNDSKTAVVSNPVAAEGTRGFVSIQMEQTTSIYADLLSAVRGASTTRNQNPSPKRNPLGGLSSLKEEIFKKKVLEANDARLAQRNKAPFGSTTKNLSLKASTHSFKENLRPMTTSTPLGEKTKSVADLKSRISELKKSMNLQDENKLFQSIPTESTIATGNSLTQLTQGNDTRENLSKIFDSMDQNRTPGAKAGAANKENPFLELSAELDRIRYQSKKDLEKTPVDKLAARYQSRGTNLLTPTASDASFAKGFDKTPKSFAGEEGGNKAESKKNTFNEIVSLNKVYDFQDALKGVSMQEFDNLPTGLIEELVNLSSMIMQKVKDSKHYAKQSRLSY